MRMGENVICDLVWHEPVRKRVNLSRQSRKRMYGVLQAPRQTLLLYRHAFQAWHWNSWTSACSQRSPVLDRKCALHFVSAESTRTWIQIASLWPQLQTHMPPSCPCTFAFRMLSITS